MINKEEIKTNIRLYIIILKIVNARIDDKRMAIEKVSIIIDVFELEAIDF